MSRKRKLLLNIGVPILKEFVAIICSFILPRYLLLYFGSDVNGLIVSITRFLSIITFMELGIAPVVQSNLYKPLAEKDYDTASKMVVSAERFYRTIALLFVGYAVILFFVFPSFNRQFDFWYTSLLILIIALGNFVQYFWGITYQVFLSADQRSYIHTVFSIITTVLNTVLCIVFIKLGFGIHLVKLISTIVFILKPLAQNIYVSKHYPINKHIIYTKEPLQQKWNGFIQHIAAVVCLEIDVVLLTVFGSFQSVSIYSVYTLVTSGITKFVETMSAGFESLIGNLLAKKEEKLLQSFFGGYEFVIHTGVSALFIISAITIAPFVSIYTQGVTDGAEYSLPLFGALISFAYGFRCLRIPYQSISYAAGHYKETQMGALISMLLNIAISVVLVFRLQLVGVAIGTIIAMLFHTVYFVIYLSKHIINRSCLHFIKYITIDIIVGILSYFITKLIQSNVTNYFEWTLYAVQITATVIVISFVCHVLPCWQDFMFVIKRLCNKSK